MINRLRPLRHTSALSSPGTQNFLVIGGGIAGMTVAAHLVGNRHSVAILEKEETAPIHATGRSASLVDPVYVPNGDVASLAMASHELFGSVHGVLHEKESLHLYGQHHLRECTNAQARCKAIGADFELLETDQIEERFPFLRISEAHCLGAIHVPAGVAHTIDVPALYGHFSSQFHRHGGQIFHGQELVSAHRSGGAWTVRTQDTEIRAEVIVNCAGAWADVVAARCGLAPLGLVPLKRTAVETSLAPHPLAPQPHGPFVFWHSHHEPLYADFRPHGRVLLSPTDEQVVQPGDAMPEDRNLAEAVDRFMHRTHLALGAGRGRSWAGHRTFAQDRKPVIGWSDETRGFFWSAAHGGFGLECSPAMSALAADMLLGEKHFSEVASKHGIVQERFAPERLHQVGVHLR